MNAARAAVVDLCRGLVDRGLVVGTAGNVSVRDGDRIAVSPSAVDYGEMTPEMVGVHALDGTPIDAPLRATSELALHVLVHTRDGACDGEVVLHTHAPASTALSTVVDEVPLTHYYSAFFGGAVRVAPYATFGTPELAAHVHAALDGRSAALMANHGAVLVAPALAGALDRAAYLEYVCDVALRALGTGLPLRTLDAAEIDRVRTALGGHGQTPPRT
ncbi:class II aldolase/adducin family protein [Pseudonocardia abyssalis]|jgi:L-fuculose-phosphate aldolase|uniref:Class II aldolase/adducin family protein n=1 Tax=Pseudonocardia abyssalis TaxID=2792008 RepID=A0ABS6UVR9_9PSEU|nr:class II aldolase/adducin family protein [Pseudonocardia abyssalis]MBW0117138.1 class II aldolase/adducin family protein [Pseudonocardia abyssalis]MBW0136061.1 class II aldolase/adducin family protein [Pseudonocardia abyssalis]